MARLAESPLYAADEIRAALAWTRRAADRELDFAETLVLRMPAVFSALEVGRICRSKAWVFTSMCAELTLEQTEVVCTRLLPRAGGLTTGELAARIKKLAIALDPDWAARRYASAVRERNVIGYLDPDGTATVTGTGLPVEQAAAACARVEELARAAKRTGHAARIGVLRTDIYLGLLDGRWQHHTRDQIITDLLATSDGDADPDHPTEPDPTILAPVSQTPPEGETPARAADPTGATTGDHPYHGVPAQGSDTEDGGVGSSRTDEPGEGTSRAAPLARRVGFEVRVGLSTLLGRDRHPGEVPGWGAVPADVARTMVAAQRAAQWRYAVTDSSGQLLLAGVKCFSYTTIRAGVMPARRRVSLRFYTSGGKKIIKLRDGGSPGAASSP